MYLYIGLISMDTSRNRLLYSKLPPPPNLQFFFCYMKIESIGVYSTCLSVVVCTENINLRKQVKNLYLSIHTKQSTILYIFFT